MSFGKISPMLAEMEARGRETEGINYEFGEAVVDQLIGRRISTDLPEGRYKAEEAGRVLLAGLEEQIDTAEETMFIARGGTDWHSIEPISPTRIAEYVSSQMEHVYDPDVEVVSDGSRGFCAFTARTEEVEAYRKRQGHWATSRQAYEFVEEAKRQRQAARQLDEKL